MDRRKHYDNNKIQENLYQYEMGIDLGAEIEYDKRRHEAEYDQNRRSRDFKGVNDLNPQQRNRRGHIFGVVAALNRDPVRTERIGAFYIKILSQKVTSAV